MATMPPVQQARGHFREQPQPRQRRPFAPLPGPTRPGILLGTEIPIRKRIAAILPTLRLRGRRDGPSRRDAVEHLGRLVDQAIETGATEDADYLTVLDAAYTLEDVYAVGRNAALRPLIDAALAAVERFRREVEP